jgi:hypothetical protein
VNGLKTKVQLLKWISGGFEAFLGIPFVGGAIILHFLWTPLLFMLAMHIIIVVLGSKEKMPTRANAIGIITSCIAWIPLLGMIMHIITAILILLEATKHQKVVGQ